jgi:hypothetical protein
MVATEMNEIRTPAEEDAATEAAVLRQLLFLYPVQLSLDELLRELASDDSDFGEHDAVERAVHDLAATGLLHCNGKLLVPTRAALRCAELLDD